MANPTDLQRYMGLLQLQKRGSLNDEQSLAFAELSKRYMNKGGQFAKVAEPAMSMISGVAGTIAGGLGGLASIPVGIAAGLSKSQIVDNATNVVQNIQDKLTYQPRTEAGQQGMGTAASGMETIGDYVNRRIAPVAGYASLLATADPSKAVAATTEVAQKGAGQALGDYTLDKTGSPELATGAYMLPDLADAAIGMKGAKVATKGMKQFEIGDLGKGSKQRGAIAGVDEVGSDKAMSVGDDYRGHHTAPSRAEVEDGVSASLDRMNDMLPDDIYDPAKSWRFYGHGGDAVSMDKETANIISKFKGHPDKEIMVYRAVPKGVTGINAGDWVTVNKNYAKYHGGSWVDNGEYDIVSKKVKASDIYTDGNSIHEFGYDPTTK